ncbi:MAG: hypothetical protein IIA62_04180 [Nitrospinae bacterium]|nr:hypothetical protein [Nitrospinota bacterium]
MNAPELPFGPGALAVAGIYVLSLLGIGAYAYSKRRAPPLSDFYLGGRNMGVVVLFLTFYATQYSGNTLFGFSGAAYREGFRFIVCVHFMTAIVIAYLLFAPRLYRISRDQNFITPGDFIYYRFGSHALRIIVTLLMIYALCNFTLAQMKTLGIAFEGMSQGRIPLWAGVIGLAVIMLIYESLGGMRSVAWTDVVQGILLVGGMLLGGFCVVAVLGGPIEFFKRVAELPPKSLSAPGTVGHWTPEMLFTASTFASLGSMIQPAQWMRFYAAKSGDVLRKSALIFAAVLTSCFFFGVMLVGLGGQVLYPIVDETGAYRTNAAGQILPHPDVGSAANQFDQILVRLATGEITLPQLVAGAGIDISPVTDDSPFFYKFEPGLPAPFGLFSVFIVLVTAVVGSIGLFPGMGQIPLFGRFAIVRDLSSSLQLRVFLLMFFCLGIGFMLVEIALFQKLTLFLGQPLLALTVLLFSLLLGTGLGSLVSSRIKHKKCQAVTWASICVALLTLIYALALEHIFSLGFDSKLTATTMLLPMGLAMGFPFPLCIRLMKEMGLGGKVHMMWGLNGIASVLGSALTMIIGILLGFS